MKLQPFSKLLLIAFLFNTALFANASSALAESTTQVFHETDSGKTITLRVGETIQFSLAENIPNTTPWSSSIAWWSAYSTISLSDAVLTYDSTQSPKVLTATTFTCFGQKAGHSIVYFYKSAQNDNSLLQNPIIFSMNVVDATAQ